ncbi:MAG: thiamine diphosphokinase [Dysgonamonadaceae bacterium]|jgi:thiamine pyrophosphokinase|nr:thiamine diphosphokinase [Dysgonamonadaceae bacterium]
MNDISAVIIANGNYPTHRIPLSAIENARYIICCDGAADHFIAMGGIPDAIVGDCDSISEENRRRFAPILHPNPEQETNDLTKSVKFCAQQGKTDISIVAATGRRESHTIGNISLLAEYMRINGVKVKMITDYGTLVPIDSTTEFESYPGQQVSFFCIDPKPITLKGLKYPLNNQILTNWWQGTLNESEGEKFVVETEGRVIVFREF